MGFELGVGIVILVVAFLLIIYIVVSATKKSPEPPEKFTPSNQNDFEGDFFYIHNHLLKKVLVRSVLGNQKVDIFEISPSSKKGLNKKAASQMFTNYEEYRPKLQVYTLENGITPLHPPVEKFFGEFEFKSYDGTMIKEFHIGMVTSRFTAPHADTDVNPGANAVQGRSRVYIHNRTPLTLRLNYNIVIPPNDTLIYYGRHYLGVALGTVFKDQDGYFPDFIYKMPATDITYGVSSDIVQPSFGGFQVTDKFIDFPNEPMWLSEEAFISGPVFTNIDPNFLPTDGPTISPVDIWGRTIMDKKEIKDWSHGDFRKPFKEKDQTVNVVSPYSA